MVDPIIPGNKANEATPIIPAGKDTSSKASPTISKIEKASMDTLHAAQAADVTLSKDQVKTNPPNNPMRLNLLQGVNVQWMDDSDEDGSVWGPPEPLIPPRAETDEKVSQSKPQSNVPQNASLEGRDITSTNISNLNPAEQKQVSFFSKLFTQIQSVFTSVKNWMLSNETNKVINEIDNALGAGQPLFIDQKREPKEIAAPPVAAQPQIKEVPEEIAAASVTVQPQQQNEKGAETELAPNAAQPQQQKDQFSEVDTALGTAIPMFQVERGEFKELLKKHPAIGEKLLDLAKATSATREFLLEKNDPEMFFAFNLRKESELVTDPLKDLYEAFGDSKKITSEELALFNELAKTISGRVLIGNQQIQTDGFRLGLLDQKLDIPGRPLYGSRFEAIFKKTVNDDTLAKLRDPTLFRTLNNAYLRPDREWANAIERERDPAALAKLNLERGFARRDGSALKQKVRWENAVYNAQGGLVRATRVLTFLNPKGEMTQAKETLDLSSLGKALTYEESIRVMEYVQLLHLNLNSEVTAKWMIACQRDKTRPPYEVLDDIPATARSEQQMKAKLKDDYQTYIGALPLSDEQKRAVATIGINFTFNITGAITKALIAA